MSTGNYSEPPEPPPFFISTPSQASPYRRHTSRGGLKPATSIFDVFDVKFERYVTPIIVKATWVMAIVVGVMFAGMYTVAYFDSLIPETPKQIAPRGRQATIALPEFFDSPQAKESSPPASTPIIDKATLYATVYYAAKLIGVAIGLLWIRVALEATIVLFHIANSVASLDGKTMPVASPPAPVRP